MKDESVKQLSSARFSKNVLKRFKWMDWLEKWMCWLLFVSSSCTQGWSLCAAWIILSLNKILEYEEHIEHFSLLFKCCNEDLLFSIKENYLFKLIWILCKISVKQKDQKKERPDKKNSIIFMSLVHLKQNQYVKRYIGRHFVDLEVSIWILIFECNLKPRWALIS